MVEGHKLAKEVPIDEFLELLSQYWDDQINFTRHTFVRLNEADRKIYASGKLLEILRESAPVYAGIQNNGLYAAFYLYKSRYHRIILDVDARTINIVTFFNTDSIPKLRKKRDK